MAYTQMLRGRRKGVFRQAVLSRRPRDHNPSCLSAKLGASKHALGWERKGTMTDLGFDGRKRRYVPLSVYFGHDETSQHLKKAFGRAGLTVWACLLAAAKRSNTREGVFSYVTEAEGWRDLGLGYPDTPDFTLDEFFRATGRIKQTRKTAQGDVKHIELTRWADWNTAWKRESGAEQKSRKRAENTADIPETLQRQNGAVTTPEVEVELEAEVEKKKTLAPAAPPRARDEIWDTLEALFGRVAPKTNAHSKRNKAVTDLKRQGATAAGVRGAQQAWPALFPDATCTDIALSTHYVQLSGSAPDSRPLWERKAS
jgi:hypothetical protein